MAEFFNVVFAGEISGKADPAVVRANLGKLFNASEAILDKLFSGQPIAIKKMLDREAAMGLRAKMKLAGANTRLVQVDEQGRPLPETAAIVVAPAAPVGTMAERVRVLAEQHEREAAAKPRPDGPPEPADVGKVSTWALFPRGWLLAPPRNDPKAPLLPNLTSLVLAPTGSDVLTEKERPVVKPIHVDISALSMAAAETELLRPEERRVVEAVKVDISDLSMAAAGADVLRPEERPVVKVVEIDFSDFSLAPPGSDLEELKPEQQLVNPDISHLSIQKP